MRYPNRSSDKRINGDAQFSRISSSCNEKLRSLLGSSNLKQKVASALVDLIQLMGDDAFLDDDDDDCVQGLPSSSVCYSLSFILEPHRPYTIGRSQRDAHFVFKDSRVSKQHCQMLYDALHKKLYLLNGALLCSASNCCNSSTCIVDQFRNRLLVNEKKRGVVCSYCRYKLKASLNGVFVNGVKVSEGLAVELSAGDEVVLVCANRNRVCCSKSSIGFIVRRIVFQEEIVIPGYEGFRFEGPRLDNSLLSGKLNKRVFALRVSDSETPSSECDKVVGRAKSLLDFCKHILHSDDPVSFLRQRLVSNTASDGSYSSTIKDSKLPGIELNGIIKLPESKEPETGVQVSRQPNLQHLDIVQGTAILKAPENPVACENMVSSLLKDDHFYPEGHAGIACSSAIGDLAAYATGLICMDGRTPPNSDSVRKSECWKELSSSPGKNFYLNCLESTQQSPFLEKNAVTLPELLQPIDSISRMFIATFTNDIKWFLSYCDIPCHLPVTLACHNTERCWSADPEMRYNVPYPDFPNLVVVYPPFPEAIAFGKDRKRQGIGCHHPKLLVLQRENTLRVIVTSANLVAKQWNNVTNTIWWQDFPRRNSPDCSPLFSQVYNAHVTDNSNSDFAAQLAGFMATLVTDVPSQAYWIVELTKYDFTGASAYLVASVPGIHSYKSPFAPSLPLAGAFKCSEKFLGSVEASVVGLSHLFRAAKDSSGIQLKKLASYLTKSSEKGFRMSEVVLRRDKNVPADANAVSVLVPNPVDLSKGDCVQLGFLPRVVAKWVSPLWDSGFFRFFGYVHPQEALTAAFGEDNVKVQLILYVSQGPHFQDIPKMMEPEHVAFCSLIASVQRCTGVWRLEEVLHRYKWPEHLESDFIYGSSSIGSVNAKFLADFSAAAGKKSQQLFDSEESDPEWGCWDACHELTNPSLRIIFPTIDRVKHCGILSSKYLLCFSEKTWQRLKTVDILHDAIPNPSDRVGHPMHVKVARRRFKTKAGVSSFGWLYCGSHNMSAAAWGRQISSRSEKNKPSSQMLHVCNYELGVIFVFPPPAPGAKGSSVNHPSNLDDIHLPFVVPAPKYGPRDRPATKRAMSEALAEEEREKVVDEVVAEEEEMEVVPDEEEEEDDGELVQVVNGMPVEQEEEKVYADILWNQVHSLK